jgi:hypothetical protein
MAAGRFDRRLPLPGQGRIPIKGPFNPQDRAVDAAKVLFLIVQGEDEDAVIVNGEGTWNASEGTRPRHRTLGRHQAGQGSRRRTQVRTAGDRDPHVVRRLPLRLNFRHPLPPKAPETGPFSYLCGMARPGLLYDA